MIPSSRQTYKLHLQHEDDHQQGSALSWWRNTTEAPDKVLAFLDAVREHPSLYHAIKSEASLDPTISAVADELHGEHPGVSLDKIEDSRIYGKVEGYALTITADCVSCNVPDEVEQSDLNE